MTPAAAASTLDWPAALGILRDVGARLHRLGPETSLREALQLIAETAVALAATDPADRANAVIYTWDAARGAFDAGSRVSAGEATPLLGDTPRPNGMGATALKRRARVLSYEEQHLRFHPLKYEAGIRTSACYPLLAAGQPVGALYIALHSERRFTNEELLLLDTFVHLAAVAIYNTRQYEGMTRALQRQVEALERLQRAGRLISSRRTLDETLQEILKTALNLTGAEHGSFRLLDKAQGRLLLSALAGSRAADPAVPASLPVQGDSGVVGWVARERRPALIADVQAEPWASLYRPLVPGRAMRSELAVPLLGSGGGLEGVLNVESPRPAAFDAEAQAMLEALATQATIALQEARLLEAIEAITGRLIAPSPEAVFALLLERACDLLNTNHAAVWALEHNLEHALEPGQPASLVLRASHGEIPAGYRVPLTHSLLGTAVRTGQPVVSANIAADARLGRRDLAHRMGWAAALIVPLAPRDGAPQGALGVYTREPREFSDWDTRLLSVLGNHAAVALQLAEALAQTRLAEERQAVAETFAVLGDVSANLLHRVNNLIGLIPVRLQGLAEHRPALLEDDYAAATLHEVETGARAAMEVARETVSYLRPLSLQPTSLAACYEAAASRLAVPEHIQLRAVGLDALPHVLAGEEQLRLVLFNLLENAVDALAEADAPGRIVVAGRVAADRLHAGRSWVELMVADNGPGVPPHLRDRVFEPDFSTKHSLKKLGFGLWWARAWVQRCGGSLRLATAPSGLFDDEAGALPPGRGCAFTIRLPVAPPAAGAAP